MSGWWILSAAQGFFIAIFLLIVGTSFWQASDIYQTIHNDFNIRAKFIAHITANDVTSTINASFDDLKFLKTLIYNLNTDELRPHTEVLSSFETFRRTHPDITAITILDPSGSHILWSSNEQSTISITQEKFTRLPQPDRLIGKARYSSTDNAWIIMLRQRIKDNSGHLLGFIGSPFLLSHLNAISIPKDLQSILITNLTGQVISVWQNGHWEPPDIRLPNPAEERVYPVHGYPWVLHVQWTTAAIRDAFWQKERNRLLITLTALIILVAIGIFTQKILIQLLCLREYQTAALRAQQDILGQNEPKTMYQRLVDVVVAQTEAIGAFVVVSQANSEWLKVVAVATNDSNLRADIEQLTPSKDPMHLPYGDMIASRAFREKKPIGPINPQKLSTLKTIQAQFKVLSIIESIMAFPVFLDVNSEPAAVLVIGSNNPKHFTLALRLLLEQLSITLGLALTQLHHHLELKKTAAEIQQMAFYDSLTGLPNRRLLESQLEQCIARVDRHEKMLAVCMLDLDDFKPINDIHGHEAGDEVLNVMGQRLHDSRRKSDFIARLGGDEFVLLLDELKSRENLEQVLTDVERILNLPIVLSNGKTVQVHASMGVSLYMARGNEAPEQLLRLADHALYESKANKNKRTKSWSLFRSELQEKRSVQQLLEEDRLEVWYQPIFDVRIGKVVGLEALARLRNDQGQIMLPPEFLPHLAISDLTNLSRLVLIQALEDLAILDSSGASLWISFNETPESFRGQYVSTLQGVIAASGIEPSRIMLEILEGSDFLERCSALPMLHEIKQIGIKLALDDIGSAYASLLRLKDLPVDEIKLDQAFIRSLELKPEDLHFVKAIQELATGINVDLIVEGVETDDILDAVTALGIPFAQGNAIAKPMPLVELQAFLKHRSSTPRLNPVGWLGLYASHFTIHNNIYRAIKQSPCLIDFATLSDATTCQIHGDLQRLGVADGSALDHLHRLCHHAYKRIGESLTTSPANNDWSAIEQADKAFSKSIIEAYQQKKAQSK